MLLKDLPGGSAATTRARLGELADRRLSLSLILILAAAVRAIPAIIAAFLMPPEQAFHLADTPGYLEPATSLIAGHGFTRANGAIEILRTPGYPLLLAAGLATGHLEATVITLQVALSTLCVALVYAISSTLFASARTARASALTYALEPLSILYASRLLTETLFAILLALFVLLLLQALRTGSVWIAAAAALTLALAAYVRPVALPLCLIVPGAFSSAATCPRPLRQRLWRAALFLVVAAGLPVLWVVRNDVRAGYRGFSAIGDQNLYFFKAAAVIAEQCGEPFADVQRRLGYEDVALGFPDRPDLRAATDAEKFSVMRTESVAVLRAHPMLTAEQHVAGVVRTALDPGALGLLKLLGIEASTSPDLIREVFVDRGLVGGIVELLRTRPMVAASSAMLAVELLALYVLVAVALLCRRWRSKPQVWLVAALVLYFVVVAGGPEGAGRYRHPVMPLLCVLAGPGAIVALRTGKAWERSFASRKRCRKSPDDDGSR